MSIDIRQATEASIHGLVKAKAMRTEGTAWLVLTTRDDAKATVFLPDHVARLTADTINRALLAKPNGDGSFTYTTDAGKWLIFPGNNVTRGVWTWQHDDAEPGDPRHGTARDLFDCMDDIDAMTAEAHDHDPEAA